MVSNATLEMCSVERDADDHDDDDDEIDDESEDQRYGFCLACPRIFRISNRSYN